MFSPTKKIDKEILLLTGEIITQLVKINTTKALDIAESLGESYLKFEDKIRRYDYTELDKIYYELYK